MRRFALLLLFAQPAPADEVSEALAAALTAYQAGDLGATARQVTLASDGMRLRQAAMLAALLPPAPKGWMRSETEDFAAGVAVAGGGTGAEATYTSEDGAASFRLSFIADNPMVATMSAMLGSAEMMDAMGGIEMVGDQPILCQSGSLSSLVGKRVLFQAQGASEDEMMAVVEAVDFARLARFDAP
jgi:hypothetical protein